MPFWRRASVVCRRTAARPACRRRVRQDALVHRWLSTPSRERRARGRGSWHQAAVRRYDGRRPGTPQRCRGGRWTGPSGRAQERTFTACLEWALHSPQGTERFLVSYTAINIGERSCENAAIPAYDQRILSDHDSEEIAQRCDQRCPFFAVPFAR